MSATGLPYRQPHALIIDAALLPSACSGRAVTKSKGTPKGLKPIGKRHLQPIAFFCPIAARTISGPGVHDSPAPKNCSGGHRVDLSQSRQRFVNQDMITE
jgi:hypothetical protein